MIAIAILLNGILNIVCFYFGTKLSQQVVNNEKIELPKIKTISELKDERRERKEAELEKQKLDIILKNIENYDGTDNKQEDVPNF